MSAIERSKSENYSIGWVKRWLASLSPSVVKVSLSIAPDGMGPNVRETPLAEWLRADATPEIAEDCVILVQEHVAEVRQSCTGNLRALDEHDRVLGTKVIQRRFVPETQADGLTQVMFTGDSQSQAQQAQAHLERLSTLYIGSMKDMMNGYRTALETLAEQNANMAAQLAEARVREEQARAEARESDEQAQMLAIALKATPPEQQKSPEQQRIERAQDLVLKVVEPHAPQIGEAMMRGLFKFLASGSGGGSNGGGGAPPASGSAAN
jgi:septal ring factor EnvC (AmiA/AmiB activator)